MIIPPDSSNKTITLSDQRRLGYAEYGCPDGRPLFFFHGWPGSRLRAKVYHEIAEALHIRLIAIDRPGFGSSDPRKNRTLLDWPADLLELADCLNLAQFAIMGISGGGPYAAACAYKIPERLTKVGIVAAPAPVYLPGMLDGLPFVYKLGWLAYAKVPIAAYLSSALHRFAANHAPTLLASKYRSESDLQVYAKHHHDLLLSNRECFRQGARPPAWDILINTRNWGFDLGDIRAKVYLWYGETDKAVPPAMGAYFANQIKESEMTLYPHEGHLISITHAQEILTMLIS
jgi:pimeloyl-ACP methyl ester carboxylesterase